MESASTASNASTASTASNASNASNASKASKASKASTKVAVPVEEDDMNDVDDIDPELSAAAQTLRNAQQKKHKQENKSMYDKYWRQASNASGKNLSVWFSLFADAQQLAKAMKKQLHANAKPLCGVFQPGSAYSPTGASYHNEDTHAMLSVKYTQEFADGEVSEPGQQLPKAQDKYTSTHFSLDKLPEKTRQQVIDALNKLYEGKNKGMKMLVGKSHMAKYRKYRKATKYHVPKAEPKPLTPEQRKAKQERDKRHRALKKAKKEADKAEQAEKAKQDARKLEQIRAWAKKTGVDLDSVLSF